MQNVFDLDFHSFLDLHLYSLGNMYLTRLIFVLFSIYLWRPAQTLAKQPSRLFYRLRFVPFSILDLCSDTSLFLDLYLYFVLDLDLYFSTSMSGHNVFDLDFQSFLDLDLYS